MKRIILLCLSVLFCFSACSMPQTQLTEEKNAASESEKFAGVWLTYAELSVKGKSYTEESYREYISDLFLSFKEKGITDVFVHVRAFSDALYNSELFETSEYASGKRGRKADFDILQICISEGKKRSLKIHAWINPYRVMSAFRENALADGIIRKWYEEDENTVCRVSGGLYLNPASDKVQKLIVDGIREILSSYDVDGIHFDDYFYPPSSGNFDRIDYEAYKENGGKLSLSDFRRENINNLLSLSYSTVKSYGREKIFSVSPSGDIDKNYNGIYADVALWCKGGFCDMIIPQLYYGFRNETKPFGRVLDEWLGLCDGSNVKLCVGLALYKVGETDDFAGEGRNEWVSDDTVIKRQKALSEEKGVFGVAYFSASFLENINF